MSKNPPEIIQCGSITGNSQTVFTLDNSAKGPVPTGYDYITVHSTGTFVATLTLEVSNDNNNWVVSPTMINQATPGTLVSTITTTGGVYIIPLISRYVRLRSTAYTSGTAIMFAVGCLGELVVLNEPTGTQAVSGTVVNSFTPLTTGGWYSTTHHLVSAATTNATSVKATAGIIGSIEFCNASASNKFVKIYNKATAPTVGTDTPVKTIMVPANWTVVQSYPNGFRLATGIGLAITGGITVADTTAVALNDVVTNITYV